MVVILTIVGWLAYTVLVARLGEAASERVKRQRVAAHARCRRRQLEAEMHRLTVQACRLRTELRRLTNGPQ